VRFTLIWKSRSQKPKARPKITIKRAISFSFREGVHFGIHFPCLSSAFYVYFDQENAPAY
jgi:hypothetical protein